MWESIDKSQQTKHNLSHPHMGHRRIVRMEKDSRFMRSRLDNILQQNRTTVDRHILGEEPRGEFISGRNARPVRPTHLCQSAFRVL